MPAETVYHCPDFSPLGHGWPRCTSDWKWNRVFLPIPTSSTILGVAVSKVSLSIDEDVLVEARSRAGRRELSSYVNDALRRQLQRDRLAELLAEMEADSGPIPDDVMEQARQPWRSPVAKRRRSP